MTPESKENLNEYVSVQLTGGLGNQLFGLAAVISLAKRRNLLPAVSLYEFSDNARPFELTSICSRMEIPFIEDHKLVYKEQSIFEYDDNVETIKGETRLIGYFQNYRYFHNDRALINETFLSISERKSLEVISPTIAVHVRRGDYLIPIHFKHHGVCDFAYYADSVSILRSIWGNLPVKIFSDDANTAFELSSIIPNSTPFNDDGLSPWEILLEMSKMKCLVASNSSFSWWAGYLGQNSYGEMIIPEPWINAKSNISLKLPAWISLPRIGLGIPESVD